MKNLVSFLFVVIIAGFFTGCQKEEMVMPVDTEAIRVGLAKMPVLTKEEVQQKITEQNSLKSAVDEQFVLVRIFPLDQQTYEIFDNLAIKYFVYYEIDKHGYRTKFLTIAQQFNIVDGEVVKDGYSLKLIVGCPFNRYFEFEQQDDIDQITAFFHFTDGSEFGYYLDRNSGGVKLPPIAGGTWQLNISYYDGEMSQSFMSNMINFWEDELVSLRFYIKTTSKIHLEINRSYLPEGIELIQVVGEDENGNWNYFLLPVTYEGFDQILNLDLPFEIDRIYICGEDGCWIYDSENWVKDIINGVIYYRLL